MIRLKDYKKKKVDLLSPDRIKQLISKEKDVKKLESILPDILRYALSLGSKRAHSPTLSASYKGHHGKEHLEVSYYGGNGRIYAAVYDLKKGVHPESDSGLEEVSEEEFLKWAIETPVHMMDVYTHLKEYIRQEDQSPVEVPSELFEGWL